jgi:hypothetical protein
MKIHSLITTNHVSFGTHSKNHWSVDKPFPPGLEMELTPHGVRLYAGPLVHNGRSLYIPLTSVVCFTPVVEGVESKPLPLPKPEPTVFEAKEVLEPKRGRGRPRKE